MQKQNSYETIIIINSNIEEVAIKSVIEKVTALINENGSVKSVDEWGKRKLAYPIKKMLEGYYAVINFESAPTFITELERIYNITDEIIKYITIKK